MISNGRPCRYCNNTFYLIHLSNRPSSYCKLGGFKTFLIPESLLQPHGSSITLFRDHVVWLQMWICCLPALHYSEEVGETILHYSSPPDRSMLMVSRAESIRMTSLDVWYILCLWPLSQESNCPSSCTSFILGSGFIAQGIFNQGWFYEVEHLFRPQHHWGFIIWV